MTSSHRAGRVAALIPLLALPLVLTACAPAASGTGTGSTGSTGQAGSGALASAKAQASAISSALHSGKPVVETGPVTTGDQLCALVPVADANSALQVSPAVARAGSSTYLNGEPLCGYSDDGPLKKQDGISVPAIGISVIWGPIKEDPYDPSSNTYDGKVMTVSGLGDAAFTTDSTLTVKKGDHTLELLSIGSTTPSRDRLAAFAKVFIDRL